MHSPDQQPAEETQEQQGLQPLYEFPPGEPHAGDSPQPAPITQVLPGEGQEPQGIPLHEGSQQGFVYPPPPSYYQNMALPPQHPTMLPPAQRMAGEQAPNVPQRQMYQGRLQSPPLPGAPPLVPHPPVKKSKTWIWIVVTILSVAVLASCGLCGWGAYNIFSSTVQQVSGSMNVVNDYYSDLQSKNYTAAYTDLAPQGQLSGLTQAQFMQQAIKRDIQYGPVVSFVPGQPSLGPQPQTTPDLSRLTITVDVKRTHLSYTVLLTVRKIGRDWKITEYDQI